MGEIANAAFQQSSMLNDYEMLESVIPGSAAF